MLLAVFVGVGSVIAFKPIPVRGVNKVAPGDKYAFLCCYPISVVQNGDGTYTVTYLSGCVTNITGKVLGVDYICVEPVVCYCTMTETATTQIIFNPDGSITITNVIIERGEYVSL